MNNTKKEIENLKTELASLKIKIRRIEGFLLCIPNSEEWIHRDVEDDDLIEEAKKVVVDYDRASASLIQRSLSIGYVKASMLLDKLEQLGIVGPGVGGKPREVLQKNPKSSKK